MPVNTTIKLRRGATGDWSGKTLAAGEVALDTTTGKVKFGTTDGQSYSSAKDVAVVQSDYATNISGGDTGKLVYQSSANTTTFLDISGNANKSLVANGAGTAPTWVFPTVSTTYFATTTSSQLLGVVTDATGSNKLVFSNSPSLVTPTVTSDGIIVAQSSGSNTSTIVSQVTGSNVTITLPSATGTLALDTVTASFLKADGTVQGSANAYMTGTLAVGSTGFSVTTAGNLATAGTVTLSGVKASGKGIVNINPSTGALSSGKVTLDDSTNVENALLPANGGLGVNVGTTAIGADNLAKARSVTRIFVQSSQPASGNITGYTPAVGDLWFW